MQHKTKAPGQVIAVMGILVSGVGLLGLLAPEGLVGFLSLWLSASGLWTAVILRLAVAIFLWLSAPASRTPAILKTLGVLVAVSGLALPFVGLVRLESWMAWWVGQPLVVVRLAGLAAIGLGVFVLWSVSSPGRATS